MNVGSLFKVMFHLPNYDMHYQVGNCPGHTHCGLITYVHNSFKSNEININYDATGWVHLIILAVGMVHIIWESMVMPMILVYYVPQ